MANFVIIYVPFFLIVQIAAGASLRLVVVFVVHITAAGAVVVLSRAQKYRVWTSTGFWPLESMTRPSQARARAPFTKK
jgi:cell division protein FtsW (lipid II flippase)